jgi:hypothetical protein
MFDLNEVCFTKLERQHETMDTSLERSNLVIDELDESQGANQDIAEREKHIHMPGPSLWPLALSFVILITVIGLLYIPDAPWLTVLGVPFIILCAIGWALEDPMKHAGNHEESAHRYNPSLSAQEVRNEALVAAERVVTFGSTAYSTHPINVEIENEIPGEGVVLTLYGKVELQTQRERLEEEVRKVPNVVEVKNYVVAEDAILATAYQRIDAMRTQGKLEGAQGVSVLVENYILHIYGDVPKTSMKYALERELIGIPGVRVVVNHIGLNKDIPGNLGKTANKI